MVFSTKTKTAAAGLIIIAAIFAAGLLYRNASVRQEASREDMVPVTAVEFMMNTVVEFRFYGENAQAALDAARSRLSELEAELSAYLEGSQIGQLNKNAGKEYVKLSPQAFEILKKAKEYSEESGGEFDVTVAPVVMEWGITGQNPHIPDQGTIDRLLELVDYNDILLDEKNSSAMLAREGQAVDLGAIAKGAAASIAGQAAADAGCGSGFISIGGNIVSLGKKPNGEDFRFGVRDPRGGQSDYFAVVRLADMETMSTSGDYERYFERDSVRYHHIFDTKTGYPAVTDLMSVTVISENGGFADYLSTYIFVGGTARMREHLNAPGYRIIAVDKDMNVYYSPSLEDTLTRADKTGNYKFID